MFNGWKRVKFNDLEVNFWDLDENSGRKIQEPLGPSITTGPVFSRLDFYNQGTYKGTTYMREVCNVRTYAIPEEDIWIFDIYIRQKPVDPKNPRRVPTYFAYSGRQKLFNQPGDAETQKKAPIELTGATVKEKEAIFSMELLQSPFGGLTFRGTDAWSSQNAQLEILTSENKTGSDGDGTKARWIDYTGPLGIEWGGIAVFDNPLNQSYPNHVNINSKIPYFSYTVTKNKSYTIKTNNPVNLIYRFLVHNGKPDKELNERIANDFVNAPKIGWEPVNY